jgi:transposase InsO family protein
MKAKRKRHDPQFKARVGLEPLKGVKTIQQIAKEYDVHPTQVSDWKKTMSEGVSSLFASGRTKPGDEEFGHEAIWCKPRTSIPDDGHRKYPYLLRNLPIERSDQVWCADITCVPMPGGHAYLCAVMAWHSRKVLG